jgi:hypothetical protein
MTEIDPQLQEDFRRGIDFVQLVFEISAELGIHIVEASGIAEPMLAELADYAAQWDADAAQGRIRVEPYMTISESFLVARIEYARKQAKRCEERHSQAQWNNDPASAEAAWDQRNRWRGERDAYEKMLYVLKNDPVWLDLFGLQ